MDTRRAAGVFVSLVGLVILTGCSTPSSDSLRPQSQSDETTTAQLGDARDDVMVVDSVASLKEDYATIRELAASKNLVAVVRGAISATRDVYLDRFAFRILTVHGARPTGGWAG